MTNTLRPITRREALALIAVGATACVGDTPANDDGAPSDPNGEGEGEGAGEGEGEGEGEPPPPLGPWAAGGTAAMTAAAIYPDPFANDEEVCALTCDMTLGPCFAASPRRADISEGLPGVPVRLALRVVMDDGAQAGCAPVAGADVDIWHCGADGLYTGDDAHPFCTRNDAGAEARRTFRGTLTTDADGRVAFDTIFPGWYPGRAVHIHVQVRGPQAVVASQLFFDEDITASILGTVDAYRERGQPDTDHEHDLLSAVEDPSRYILRSSRMPDGALLAARTIALRAPGAPDDPACG